MPPVEHSLSENGFTDTYLVARSGTELVVLMPLSYLENNSYYANPPPSPDNYRGYVLRPCYIRSRSFRTWLRVAIIVLLSSLDR